MKLLGLDNILWELNQLKSPCNILFQGARGTGKTTLSRYLANKFEFDFIETEGSILDKRQLLKVLLNIVENKKKTILYIDEIHSLPEKGNEILYKVMEGNILNLQDREGNSYQIHLPEIYIIGATTKPAELTKPLLSRFQLILTMPDYSIKVLAKIIQLKFPFSIRESLEIANCVFTPREAINLSIRVNNLKEKMGVREGLKFLGFKRGLSIKERQYLKILSNLERASKLTMSASLQLDKSFIEEIENKLIRKGLIIITMQGRKLTDKGFELISRL